MEAPHKNDFETPEEYEDAERRFDDYVDTKIEEAKEDAADHVEVGQVIVVEQKPIITYSLLEQISKSVQAKIASLNIETLEPTEENLSEIKKTRADLGKDFKTLEDQRKMVKEIVLKDYNKFEDEYKRLIAGPLKDADGKLKTLADVVTDKILQVKIDGIKSYFTETNEHDFIKFEDLELKIIKSRSDKDIKKEIDDYLATVNTALQTIDTLPNKDRVLAKFHGCKDLSKAIADVNIDMRREQQIKEQNEARLKAQQEAKERAEQQQREREAKASEEAKEAAEQYPQQPAETCEQKDGNVYKCTFAVYATKDQLGELKKYMKERGIRYE